MGGLGIPFLALALSAGALTPAADGSRAVHPPPGSNAEWREGEVIVSFRSGVDRGDIVQTLEAGGAHQARAARQGSTADEGDARARVRIPARANRTKA